MQTASVSNLDLFRTWREDEDLDLGWLLTRILGKEPPTEAMQAGTALHEALEHAIEGELGVLASGDYRFDINCDCQVILPTVRELSVQKVYGDLEVRGRVDGIIGKTIIDYKSTGQFDADRLMSGAQWKLYLDMMEADTFKWQVFVISEFGPPFCYEVKQVHELTQVRYPGMHEDCENLAREYSEFMKTVDTGRGVAV
jgi:hypothetical protein